MMVYCRKSLSQISFFALWSIVVASSVVGPADAQCPWEAAPNCGTGSGPFSMCDRNLAYAADCGGPMNNGNGTVCTPPSAGTGLFNLSASQPNTAFQNSAFCSWGCTYNTSVTGTCRINLSDGLPVELMEFSVGNNAAGGEEQEGGGEDDEDDLGPADG